MHGQEEQISHQEVSIIMQSKTKENRSRIYEEDWRKILEVNRSNREVVNKKLVNKPLIIVSLFRKQQLNFKNSKYFQELFIKNESGQTLHNYYENKIILNDKIHSQKQYFLSQRKGVSFRYLFFRKKCLF